MPAQWWHCYACDFSRQYGERCERCGRPPDRDVSWVCLQCGFSSNFATAKFCSMCARARPVFAPKK